MATVAGFVAGIGTFTVIGGVLIAGLAIVPPREPVDLDMLGKGLFGAIIGAALVLLALAMRA